MPNQPSTGAKTFVPLNSLITSARTAGLEIKSGEVLIKTIVKMEALADNGIRNWPMNATTAATIRIC